MCHFKTKLGLLRPHGQRNLNRLQTVRDQPTKPGRHLLSHALSAEAGVPALSEQRTPGQIDSLQGATGSRCSAILQSLKQGLAMVLCTSQGRAVLQVQ